MRETYPKREKIDARKIYVDPDEMFDGIEKVYPDKIIIQQDHNNTVETDIYSENGCFQCVECGNTGLMGFEHNSGKAHISFDEDGVLQISLEAALIPIGPIKIYDEDEESGLFDILQDYLQQYNFICANCGYIMAAEMYNIESHHDCPGCFLCMRSDRKEAIDFCTEEAFAGRCTPGKDCQNCQGYYNMVKYDIKPENVLKSSHVAGKTKKVLEKMKRELYETHNI